MNFTIGSGFLDAVASSEPTPGGGSAAAYSGALAAALVAMIARTTIGKKKYAPVEARMKQIVYDAEACRVELEVCVSRDAAAFDALLAAIRAPKEGQYSAAVEQAALQVTEVPLGTAKTALYVLELAIEVAANGNINALSDACSGASLANCAIFASGLNVKFNAKSLGNRDAASSFLTQLAAIEARTSELMAQLNNIIRERGGIG
jgi:formiminotetrahydrofolate cyclodeaminase